MSTGAILNRLQRDRTRQKQLIFGSAFAVLAILAFIVVLERGSTAPQQPSPVSKAPPQADQPETKKYVRPPVRSHLTPAPEPEAPPEPVVTSLRMHVTCSHGVGIWIDNRKYGTCRTLDLDLPPGPHSITARKGRHTMNENIDLDAALSVRIDGVRRRISVQKLP